MEYIIYDTEAENIKNFIKEISDKFNTYDEIEYEKLEELLLIKIKGIDNKIIYTEFDEPLKIKPYKKVLHSIVLIFSNENESRLFYRLKRKLKDNEKRISLLSIKRPTDLKEKIEELLILKDLSIIEKKYKTFLFTCSKENEEKIKKTFSEIPLKNTIYIPFSIMVTEDNIIDSENKTFIGQIEENYIKEFIIMAKDIGIDIEKIIFFESSLFSYQK
ncbi:MAG TPA: hypothetical protein PKW55_04925 [Spirochaetota bacterium]|mgnify:CR=1 FL=1|nr:hypothetical protein [Spirochaetota bacterium]HOM37705.1 hypothetical protein [Spirochaetota bacterium]HPQ49663.1 hypothetical protein [Spirochaetota bacterium]